MKFKSLFVVTCALFTALPGFAAVTVEPVPWDPTNLTSPHTVITGVQATLAATVNLGGSGDSFTYTWDFGDGPPVSGPNPITISNHSTTVGTPYNLSVTHTYTAAAGTAYTAVLTVTDTTNPATYTGNYYVIVQNNTLSARVNQAIDNGLWYLHTTEDRTTTTNSTINNGYQTGNATLSPAVAIGSWDGQLGQGCLGSYDCLNSAGLNATNVQAFEVSGHYENEANAAVDPYADDVARGLARIMMYMQPEANTAIYPYYYYSGNTPGAAQKTVNYNPALGANRCSDGSLPSGYPGASQSCTPPATLIAYNPTAASCVAPPCTIPSATYDGNTNGQVLLFPYAVDGEYDWGYQTGMIVTAIVASQNKAGVARTGATSGPCVGVPSQTCPGVLGQTYLNIVQDLIDGIGFCQYFGDNAESNGGDNGGGWEYYCAGTSNPDYDDNSPSQWDAIAMIAANRGFGIVIPQIVTDTNQVWATWDQCFGTTCTTSGYTPGMYGYNAWNDPIWGPWAVTPSGLVQLAMDGVGRTAAGNPDQRWNLTESYYHDNFCNSTGSATTSPKNYTYGLFSFTKSMEEHDPGGVLAPITLLEDVPSGTGPIDWYGAQNGVMDPITSMNSPCDGVAQTLVSRQNYGGVTGAWYDQDYEYPQDTFETAWSTIMLQKTSFVACVTNLAGVGKASSRSSGAEVTLSWSGIGDATGYQVQRSNVSGGPYTNVGSPTASLAFVDQTSGLVNGDTYYYVLQPLNGTTAVCQSNQAAIKIP